MKDIIFNLWKKIILSKNILLINHIRMDPDAFWSLGWFYLVLKKLWKNIKAVNDELPPESFSFIWLNHIFETNLDIAKFNPDLIISFDASSIDLLWEQYLKYKEVFEKSDFFVIDHHATNNWFWKYNIVNNKSSSTCELVFYILKELNLLSYVDKHVASSIYTWIITDTNIFYNSNTTKETLKTASELIWLWADFRAPIFEFYKKRSFNKVKLWWEILKNLKSENNWKIIYALIATSLFEKTKTSQRDISWLINEFLSNVDKMEVCFLIYPLEDSNIKVSFRSSWFNVWEFSEKFWWWWHIQSAWFLYKDDKDIDEEERLKKVEKMILKLLKKEI